jgi:hypothetical protein
MVERGGKPDEDVEGRTREARADDSQLATEEEQEAEEV